MDEIRTIIDPSGVAEVPESAAPGYNRAVIK